MNRTLIASLVLGSAMALSAGAAKLATPTVYLSDHLPAFNLDIIIPVQIGEWSEEKNLVGQVVNPQTEELINKLYSQTLSRTYVNGKGERIMLSIAYGTDQRDGTEVHHPEICYPAQGFQLKSNREGTLVTPKGNIPVSRLETNLANQRFEPVTYWITVGDKVISGGMSKKLARMFFGLNGMIPDGLVFRVSSIDVDTAHAFLVQDAFVNALVAILKPGNDKRLTGLN